MNQHIAQRLQELRDEFEIGQKRLNELEAQASNIRNTLLRISGAIQVLEELLAEQTPEQQNGAVVLDAQQASA